MKLLLVMIGRQKLACLLIVMLASCTRANSLATSGVPSASAPRITSAATNKYVSPSPTPTPVSKGTLVPTTAMSTARTPTPVTTRVPASAMVTPAEASNKSAPNQAVGTETTVPPPASHPVDRDALVRKMLQTNGGCELPCWWGIIPGRSDAATTEQQLRSYGGPVFPIPSKGQKDYEVYIEVQPQQNGIVRALRVSGSVPGAAEGTSFASDFRSYSLGDILTRLGRPSQVRLELSNACFDPPCTTSGYGLYLIYEHLGVLIAYYAPTQRGDPVLLCPQFAKVGYIRIALQSPADVTSLYETAKISKEQIEEDSKPLEEVTDMTIDEFYRIFKEHADTMCISSAASHWPK